MSLRKIQLPLSLLGILLLLCIYFLPLFQGKVLSQNDILGWKGMVHETEQYAKATGKHTYWTGTMFSGMPTIAIESGADSNLFSCVKKAFSWIPEPVWYLFLYFVGFYVLLRTLGVKHWLALLGGLGYMLSNYWMIIIMVGHVTKFQAMAYVAFVVAGIVLTYRRRYLWGGLLFAISLSLQVFSNHPQITYYLIFIVAFYGIFRFVEALKRKELKSFGIATAVLVLGAILAAGTNAENLYKVYDYAKVSIRGEQILQQENANEGVDLNYATAWSYGVDELFTLLIPSVKGGASNGRILEKKSETYAALQQLRVKNPQQAIQGVPVYWGKQPFTEGGVYLGAIIFFLFVFGLLTVKGYMKWWLLAATLLSVLLALGHNLQFFYNFFYNYFPLFSKFRTPSMILVIAQFTVPFLAVLGLAQLFEKGKSSEKIQKALLWSAGITGGVCLLFWLIPSLAGNFEGLQDGQMPEPLQMALIEDRKALLKADALRSFAFVALALGVLFSYLKNKLKETPAILLLCLLVFVDMWLVDRRFLNNENYVSKRKAETLVPYKADLEVLKDKSLSYRVLDITENPFNSSRASFFHKSIGGYHAAKMRRYQDLIEHNLQPELQKLVGGLQSGKSLDEMMMQLPALRMLNLRYLLYNPDALPLQTTAGLGNAWFVNGLRVAKTPMEEIQEIENLDVAEMAVVLEEEAVNLKTVKPTEGTVTMVKYAPDELTYESQSATGGLAVFSEIYHPDWRATIDGKAAAICRVNYTLMSLEIPEGKHKVQFIFKPKQYRIWHVIGMTCSVVLLLLISVAIVMIFKEKLIKTKNG